MNRSLCVASCFLTACAVVAAPVPADQPWITGWNDSVDPDKDCKFIRDKDTLTAEAPGKDHDLAIERGLMNSPRLLRDVEGDFVAQVRLDGAFQPSNESTTSARIPFVGAGYRAGESRP
jgi:hypothetical protein